MLLHAPVPDVAAAEREGPCESLGNPYILQGSGVLHGVGVVVELRRSEYCLARVGPRRLPIHMHRGLRSEERRVGKECPV